MSISNYAEDKILDAVLNASTTGGGLPTTDPYVKLHTGDPGENGTSNAAGETTRVQVTFADASGGSCASSTDAAWTSVSTTEVYSHISLWDAPTGGNCLWTGSLTAPKAVTAGDNFTIPSGSLTVLLD